MQGVGTPRFYTNDFTFGAACGITILDKLIDGNQVNSDNYTLSMSSNPGIGAEYYRTPNYDRPNYFAVLGHQFPAKYAGIRLNFTKADGQWDGWPEVEPLVNFDAQTLSLDEEGFVFPEYSGFSIAKIIGASSDDLYHGVKFQAGTDGQADGISRIGTIFYGRFYDMTASPNLSLTLGMEFGKTKETTTYNGSSISNTMWTKPPGTGRTPPWTLIGPSSQNLGESIVGRRTWDLSFSFLNDSDVFGPNQMLSTYSETDTGYGDDIGALGFSTVPFTNGTFDDNYDGWEPIPGSSSELTHATDKLQISMPAGFGGVHQTEEDAIIGKTYQVSADIWQGTTANTDIVMTFGGKNEILVISDTQQKFTMEITPETLTAGFNIHSTSGDGGTIFLDNVEVKINNYDNFNDNILSDDNFFSFWHKTLGGNLPFIFQPDNTNFDPDQFALAKIANNSMKVTQTAFNVYDISLKIEEAW
ncbi:MAG: hypothetical protein CMB80_01570 [Flammeovirgaceae bacterium]|nr:hypothetical protein [Flammeovirgaceae bacterium]|tara:strand:+ start:505 stop:1920 length:1416 start_codon:yes stop_codon:yes gene_type:complete